MSRWCESWVRERDVTGSRLLVGKRSELLLGGRKQYIQKEALRDRKMTGKLISLCWTEAWRSRRSEESQLESYCNVKRELGRYRITGISKILIYYILNSLNAPSITSSTPTLVFCFTYFLHARWWRYKLFILYDGFCVSLNQTPTLSSPPSSPDFM